MNEREQAALYLYYRRQIRLCEADLQAHEGKEPEHSEITRVKLYMTQQAKKYLAAYRSVTEGRDES